jgi:trehalose 6-phosphate phosphatase
VTAGTATVEQAVRALGSRSQEVALCLDFDGTLSPVVDDPQAARPLQGVVELLGPLARRFAAVALVSGRPAAYLGEHAAAPGVRYLGLYGLQEMRDGQVQVDPRLEAARPAVAAAAAALRDSPAVRDSGAWLEDKVHSVAVHTRRVPDRDRWTEPIDRTARQIAEQHGLELIPGKLVWELRPPVPSDKGDAVRRVVAESGARAVVVVGDDLGDLPAFAAVAELAAGGRDGLRVAVRSEEAPPELLATADLVLDGPRGVLDFLRRLADSPVGPPGDYGYDLAHEETGRAPVGHDAPGPAPGQERGGAPVGGGQDERSADLGYDEAHDF